MNIQEAKKISGFCSIARIDGTGTVVRVPGHSGRVYFVKVSPRWDLGEIQVECRHGKTKSGKGGHGCPGNSKSVCYHSLAAVLFLQNQGRRKKLAVLCGTIEDAKRLANLKNDPAHIGNSYRIVSAQSGAEAGIVIPSSRKMAKRAANAKAFRKLAHEASAKRKLDGVTLLRGTEEDRERVL